MSSRIAVLILAALVAMSCSNQSKQILGKWENKKLQQQYEFRADGKYEYSGSGEIRQLLGPYRIEKNLLYLTARMPAAGGQWEEQTTEYEFKIEGDILTLKKPDVQNSLYSITNPSVEYKRIAK